jgi:hypothetical protein
MRVTVVVTAKQSMVAWALRHICCQHLYYLYELGVQAWLNEFQGDSFRLVGCSPHLWNDKATRYLGNSYLTIHLKYYLTSFRFRFVDC